jgi:hypothetical protein
MTLMELLTTIHAQGHIKKAGRVKDIKTSLRYLAHALGHATMDQCQEATFRIAPSLWQQKLDTHFSLLAKQGKKISPNTIRNTRNNLRFFFRTAEASGLLPPPDRLPELPLTRHAHQKTAASTAPFYSLYVSNYRTPYRLPLDQWPVDIQASWHTYRATRELQVRKVSLDMTVKILSSYLGFLITLEGLAVQWQDLFTLAHIDRFVRWHSARNQTTITRWAKETVGVLHTLAMRTNAQAEPAIRQYLRELPTPEPRHDKRRHGFTLRELETVGLSALEDAHTSTTSHGPTAGLFRSLQHQHALMLRLLVRVPLRQRNLRELHLGKNLYKDESGHWHLHFSGSELKISTRQGRVNEYHVDLTDYCPTLLPHLEEFLTIYRPRIPHATESSLLFLTQYGRPYTVGSLRQELSSLVLRRTNKHFHPHLIRTIWASEYLSTNNDFEGAATLLGDTVEVVLKIYYEIHQKKAYNRASQFLATTLT